MYFSNIDFNIPESEPLALAELWAAWRIHRYSDSPLPSFSVACCPVQWMLQSFPLQHCSAPIEAGCQCRGEPYELSWWNWWEWLHFEALHDQASQWNETESPLMEHYLELWTEENIVMAGCMATLVYWPHCYHTGVLLAVSMWGGHSSVIILC